MQTALLKKIATDKAPAAIGPYSQGIIANGFLFASGQIPIDPATGEIRGTDITGQAELVMENIGEILKEAGITYEDVVKTTCFLADMADFAAFNAVYEKYFTGKPARSCVAVKQLPKNVLCEVEVIGVVRAMDGKGNIILIGMPGAGKSTVGVVLAKKTGRRFLDSDLLIQDTYGALLHELISEHGTEGFLKIEEEVNACIKTKRTVIATGGSVVYGEKAMEHFQKIGTVVYLKLSCDAVKERLGDLDERGVVLRDGQTLEDLYRERIPLYEKYAGVTINCEGKSIREVVSEICRE